MEELIIFIIIIIIIIDLLLFLLLLLSLSLLFSLIIMFWFYYPFLFLAYEYLFKLMSIGYFINIKSEYKKNVYLICTITVITAWGTYFRLFLSCFLLILFYRQ